MSREKRDNQIWKAEYCPRCSNVSVYPAMVNMPVLVENSPVKSIEVKGWKCKTCNEVTYSHESMQVMERFRATLKEFSATLAPV